MEVDDAIITQDVFIKLQKNLLAKIADHDLSTRRRMLTWALRCSHGHKFIIFDKFQINKWAVS